MLVGVSLPLRAQEVVDGGPGQLFVLPSERSAVVLQTQTTDMRLTQSGDSAFLAFDGFYRLRNSSKEAIPLNLRIASHSAAGPSNELLPSDLAITANGAPLAIEEGAEGPEVRILAPADGRIDLRLTYTLDLGSQPMLEISYPVAVLQAWPGSVSQRTTITLPATMSPAGWLTVQPEGWTYAPPSSQGDLGVQWLFEGRLPETPIRIRMIHPNTWQQIVQTESVVISAPSVSAWVQLGELYSQVLSSARDSAIRTHLYVRALAAYEAALDIGGALNDLAPAHLGQAALYRGRLLNDAGVVNPSYARLLVEAAAQALNSLPLEHPQRGGLSQWLNEGLSVALADARNRRDWQAALGMLDLLERLPPGLVAQELITDERRRITVEQSLQMLEEGQRDAAVAISGGQIVAEELQPPADSTAIFAAWQVTMTLVPGGVTLHFTGIPAAGAEEAAKSSLEDLAGLLHEAAALQGGSVMLRPAFEMHITLPGGVSGLALANATPLDPNWALIRAVLAQSAPRVDQESRLLQRTFRITQEIDVRNVGDQWRRIARDLEEKAQIFQSQANPSDRSDPAVLEGALAARVQAANYRAAAGNWLNLVQNSRLIAQLAGPGGELSAGRAWQISVDDSPQKLFIESQTINWTGVWLLMGAAIVVLFLLAGFLWTLL